MLDVFYKYSRFRTVNQPNKTLKKKAVPFEILDILHIYSLPYCESAFLFYQFYVQYDCGE